MSLALLSEQRSLFDVAATILFVYRRGSRRGKTEVKSQARRAGGRARRRAGSTCVGLERGGEKGEVRACRGDDEKVKTQKECDDAGEASL